jgi:hypothetical protein
MAPVKLFLLPGTLLGSCLITLFAWAITTGVSLTGGVQPVEAAQAGGAWNNTFLPAIASAAPPSPGSAVDEDHLDDNQADNPTDEDDGPCQVSSKFPEKVSRWCPLIHRYAGQHHLDPDLIAALIWQESGGDPLAYSRSGAVGLMQVMPRDGIAASFQCKNGPCFTNRPSLAELEDPEFNIRYGTRMLANLLAHHGNMREALKHYGPMDVGYYYADIVLNIYRNYGRGNE